MNVLQESLRRFDLSNWIRRARASRRLADWDGTHRRARSCAPATWSRAIPVVGRAPATPRPEKRMTRGYYSKELHALRQGGAVFSSALKKFLTHRVDCAQARISRSKISIGNAFNIKLRHSRLTTARRRSSTESSIDCRDSLCDSSLPPRASGAGFGSDATASRPQPLRTSRRSPPRWPLEEPIPPMRKAPRSSPHPSLRHRRDRKTEEPLANPRSPRRNSNIAAGASAAVRARHSGSPIGSSSVTIDISGDSGVGVAGLIAIAAVCGPDCGPRRGRKPPGPPPRRTPPCRCCCTRQVGRWKSGQASGPRGPRQSHR